MAHTTLEAFMIKMYYIYVEFIKLSPYVIVLLQLFNPISPSTIKGG